MSLFKSIRFGALALVLTVMPAGAQAQSLNDALAHAYSNNPDIASAFMSVRSAREGIRVAQGGRLPTIGAGASLEQTFTFPGGGNVLYGTTDQIGLNYNQTLFDNYATDAAIRAAEANYDAAVQGARNTEQNILLSVATAYFNVVRDSRIVQIRQENIGFVRAQLQSARDRLELGEGTQLDVAQAQAGLAQAEAAHLAAINNLRTSEANFERYVGRAPSGLTGAYNFGGLLPGSLDGALANATTRHPALLATQAQIRAAQHEAEETRAGFGPNISLTGSVGAGGFTGDAVVGQARVGVSLSVPIYTPQRGPAMELANIGQIQSELQAFATRDQVVEAVRQAWAGVQTSTSQIESATAAVAASRLALQATVDQNEVGQATTLDVLDARASLLSVEENLVSAQAQRSIAGFSLIAATGNLSAQSLGLAVQPRNVDGTPVATPVQAAPTDAWGNLR